MGQRGPEGVTIPLALSRQDVARMVGATIETAIRIMSRWNRDGVVRTERFSFLIPDRETLEQIVSEG